MKLSNFLNLSFHEASEHIRKSVNERIKYTWSSSDSEMIEKIKRINLEDVEWITESSDNVQLKKNQGFIEFHDQYYFSRISADITLYYDDYFMVTYHVGNTKDGVTLREISLVGNGKYWSDTIPELTQIEIRKTKVPEKASFKIPRVFYRNGRKGSLADFVKKQYNLIKLRYQTACQEFTDYAKSGKLKEVFESTKENDSDPWSSYYRYMKAYKVSEFTSDIIQSISDPGGLSLPEAVTYAKVQAGYFSEFPETSSIRRSFYLNSAALSGGQVKTLRSLLDRIKRNYDLEKKLGKLQEQIKTMADYYIMDFVQDNPRYTIEDVEDRLMRVSYRSLIDKTRDL